ncbi:MAG: acetate--CoA ligase family protein [Patescibacteria group bacterium]
MNIKNFLEPKGIAIIGASKAKEKIGWQILSNLIDGEYKGKIFPINLKEKEIAGLSVYQNVKAVKEKIDLAVIVIPADFVAAEVANCGEKGIKNIIIISSGFAEVGEEGKKREEKIKELAEKYNLNILGPNCLGVISSPAKLDLTFAQAKAREGNLAFISQSGAIGSAVLDWIQDKNIGFSHFVSLGNQAVMKENDFFEFFLKDKKTDFVLAYLEEMEDGEKFMEIVSRLAKVKPVAVLKAGKSQAGREAALSHTGSLAASAQSVEAGLRRAGAISLSALDDLFNLLTLWQRKTKYNNSDLFMVSNAGGPLVIAMDSLEENKLALGKFSASLEKSLKKKMPSLAGVHNPFDILGDAGADRYEKSLEEILAEKYVSNLLILLTPQTATEVEKTAEIIARLGKKYPEKMICTSFIGGEAVGKVKNILAEGKIANFSYPEQALSALGRFLNYQAQAAKVKPFNMRRQTAVLKKQENKQEDYLESFRFLEKYKIPFVKTLAIKTESDLKKLKYPIALKIVGPKIIHKTENSLVLNLKNSEEAAAAWKNLKADAGNYIIAQEMNMGGAEIIVGFKRDLHFGPILMVGAGGIYAEVWQDVQLEVEDLTRERALAMIKKLKIYPVLAGARGQESSDIFALADVIVNVARLARENLDIKELDINPIFVKKKGVVAVDARIIK